MLGLTAALFRMPDLFWSVFFDCIILPMNVYPASCFVLFCTLVWFISSTLRFLRIEIEETATNKILSADEAARKLERWKRIHLIICESVNQLNNGFGVYIFIEVSYEFFSVVNNLFYVLIAVDEKQSSSPFVHIIIFWFCVQFIQFMISTYLADRISTDVSFF